MDNQPDTAVETDRSLDPGYDGARLQVGFPKRIWLAFRREVVSADPILPSAAAVVAEVPEGDARGHGKVPTGGHEEVPTPRMT